MTKISPLMRKTAASSRQIEALIRRQLESGALGVSDVLRSERDLAAEYGVSRGTVRRALARLVGVGYLVSRPRGGYEVAQTPADRSGDGPIAFVHDDYADPGEWNTTNMAFWNGAQKVSIGAGRAMLVMGMAGRRPEAVARSLREQGACGAIVNSDDAQVAEAIANIGMPAVLMDNVAGSRVPSVTQDNFGGAMQAAGRLIERGRRRLAFLGCDFSPNPNRVHLDERTGGYLAALRRAGLEGRPEWHILGHPVEGAVARLVELAGAPDGPDGAVVLWPQLLDDLGEALAAGRLRLDVVVWWGCDVARQRDGWRERFPGVPVPDGMEWSADDVARLALMHLNERIKNPRAGGSRALAPVRLIPGDNG